MFKLPPAERLAPSWGLSEEPENSHARPAKNPSLEVVGFTRQKLSRSHRAIRFVAGALGRPTREMKEDLAIKRALEARYADQFGKQAAAAGVRKAKVTFSGAGKYMPVSSQQKFDMKDGARRFRDPADAPVTDFIQTHQAFENSSSYTEWVDLETSEIVTSAAPCGLRTILWELARAHPDYGQKDALGEDRLTAATLEGLLSQAQRMNAPTDHALASLATYNS